MRYARIFVLSGFLATTAVALSFGMANPGYISNTLIGKPATDFTLDTTKSKNVNMTKYRGGKKAIIFFWATWCPHCRVELKRLNEKQDEFAAQGIKPVIVSLGEERGVVESYLQKHQYNLEVFLDIDQSLEESYRIIGVPTIVFIDENGVIKAVEHALPTDYQAPFGSP
jgi:peroxiredoxin